MEFFQQLKEQINSIWEKLSNVQKIVISASGILVFVMLFVFSFLMGKTNYEPLYPNLDLNDSAMIAAKLKDMKVDYKISEDGTTILVPTTLKHQLRLDLANQLPNGGVIGFESFNETKFGETDTDKRIRYLAALQGELTRTIQEMVEVEAAKIHIVLPEPSLFVSESKPATASVLLKLKPYANMDKQKIRSIIYFMSHSVEGLTPENVTVIDEYGNLLSEDVLNNSSEFFAAELTTNQLEVKKRFEDNLAKSLQTMLEKVKGAGKVVVRASVDMDFDQVETSKEEFGDKVIRSEQLKEETSEGVSSNSSGVPGTDSNLTDVPSYQSGGNDSTSSESSEVIRNYEINKIVENRKKAPGEIKRISVGVIIDGDLSTEEEKVIFDIIAQAAGINESRGDSLSITSLPFNNESYEKIQEEINEEASRQQMLEIGKYIVFGLGIIAVIIFAFALLRQGISSRRVSKQAAPQNAVLSFEERYKLSPEDEEKAQLQKRIEKIAKTQPDNVAKVIKTWLAEDSR